MLKKTASGIAAGICITLGGAVFLAVENRIVGAVLFSVALLSICLKAYALFTGKVGFIPENHCRDSVETLMLGLLGNTIATILGGLVVRAALPNLGAAAETVCGAKLSQVWWSTLIRGAFCGILMYLAVSTFRDNKTPVGILFCIPVFILSGYEHCVANMGYIALYQKFNCETLRVLLVTSLGNIIGCNLIPLCLRLAER